jgi:hypothetical protein
VTASPETGSGDSTLGLRRPAPTRLDTYTHTLRTCGQEGES